MKQTRRDFLKSAGAFTAGAFFIPNLIQLFTVEQVKYCSYWRWRTRQSQLEQAD